MIDFSKIAARLIKLSRSLMVSLLGLVLVLQTWGISSLSASATSIYEMPPITNADPAWVLDIGDVISRVNQGSISTSLANLAKDTGNEAHLITIHRLDYGETIESFTNQLFEKWFPTPEAQAHQLVLVLDTVTNNAAIRTGEAVKGLLSDDTASSVAQETLMAPLRNGNRYNQAFLDVSDRLVAVLSGKPDPGPPTVETVTNTEGTFATPEETAKSNATIWVIGLLLAATIIPMATYYFYQSFQS